MQRVNAGRRVGWLLRTNRVLGGRSRYRKLAAFAADFDADGVTPSVSVSTLSRWENRVTTVPGAAVRRYERMLDLRPGLLVAVNDTVARYLTPPTQTVPPWARHRRPNPGAPLDELIDLAVTDAVLGSEEWDRLTELLACRPQLVLSPASTWLRLSERLLTEMCIADGVSWMRRAEAFHRLIVHPVGQRAAMATAAAAAADTSAQSLIGTLGVFSASAHPDASSSVVRHLTDPLTDRTFYGALLTSVKKLRFGHFDDRQTASLLPILCALVASGGGERTPLAARLLQLLPRELQAKVPSRVWAAAMAALWPAAAPVSERLAAEALEGIEEPPPDPLLAVFIDEMLHDPVFDVRLCTMFLLYATPYRAPLAHALARELAGTLRRRGRADGVQRLLDALRILGGTGERRLIEAMVLSEQLGTAVCDSAAYALGHVGGASPDDFYRRAFARHAENARHDDTARSTSVLDRLVYCMGISDRRALLGEVVTRPDLPPRIRTAATWWAGLPGYIRESAAG
ncbi:hypothetical protein [Amycolatopsis solani]|uniref:hypothetical protein n=1 Tax=Amycolatopsis solani TaxID=3028615 RepID=UPI00296E718E|nr:hypothetical protein [Amycolatopsis sp. MEP2-6]